ncbi:MAG: UDP-glucose 4-epimerase [Bryobacterales bacterium]|nr:UDP-glucose 4-epimerase [Bryobacterales bacterium]
MLSAVNARYSNHLRVAVRGVFIFPDASYIWYAFRLAIVITGGAGYIGSHTAKYLANLGLEPVVIDDLRTGHREAVRWGPLVECDIADADAVRGVFERYRPEAVIHFAASAYVGESMGRPSEYFRNNVVGTLSLLDSMRASGVNTIVFSSSCAIYGQPKELPLTEATPARPVNPYGESKLFVERALEWYGRAYGLRWAALRYFNAAGTDPEGELGETHNPETHLIPLAIQAALGKAPELSIYGDDYPTADGSAVRDYVHVSDLASAHHAALEHLLAHGEGGAFNLGTGRGYSVFEVVQAVEAATGRAVPARVVPRRAGDPPVLVADALRAKKVLGWEPRHSAIEEIMRSACAWFAR